VEAVGTLVGANCTKRTSQSADRRHRQFCSENDRRDLPRTRQGDEVKRSRGQDTLLFSALLIPSSSLAARILGCTPGPPRTTLLQDFWRPLGLESSRRCPCLFWFPSLKLPALQSHSFSKWSHRVETAFPDFMNGSLRTRRPARAFANRLVSRPISNQKSNLSSHRSRLPAWSHTN
jgi:hypothetical protein